MDENVDLRNTILRALEGAAEACTSLSGFILQAAGHLRSGEIREGNALLSSVLDDFAQLVSLLTDVRQCGVLAGEDEQARTEDLDRESQEMVDLLNMAVDAQQSQDWVFLADILEYEFSQKLGSWDGLFRGLSVPVEG